MDEIGAPSESPEHHIPHELYQGFHLNQVVVLPQEGAIVRSGHRHHLAPKAMEVLLFLASNRDQVVSAHDLLSFAWGDENASRSLLSHAISEIRLALDDHKECPEFIQTIPRRGYRLISDFALINTNILFPDFWPAQQPINSDGSNKSKRSSRSWSLLRSSRLFSVSVAFILATWILIQVFEVLFPIFDIPERALKLAVLVAVIGFPLVLLVTWLKELKIKRRLLSKDAGEGQKKRLFRQLSIDFGFITLLSIGVGFIAIQLMASIETDLSSGSEDTSIVSEVQIPVNDQTVAILPAEIQNPSYLPSYILDTLEPELANVISNHTSFNVLASRAFDPQTQTEAIDRVKSLGARYFFDLSIVGAPSEIVVHISLNDSVSKLNIWSTKLTATAKSFLELRNNLNRKVVTALTLLENNKYDSSLSAIETKSFQAFENYLQAKSILLQANSESELNNAEQYLLRSLSYDNAFLPAASALCQTYLDKYDLTRAIDKYEMAKSICSGLLEYDKLTPDAYATLGSLYRVGGEYDRSAEYYQKALAIKTDFLPAINGLAKLYAQKNQHDEAMELFQRTVAIEPGYWKNHQEVGDYLYSIGRYKDAKENYQRVIFLKPNHEEALNRLGASYYMSNDFQKATVAWKKSTKLSPSASNHSNLGTAYFFDHKFERAVFHYRQAVNIEPQNPVIWGNLGDARKYSDNTSLADQAYRKALELAEKNLIVNPADWNLIGMTTRYQSELKLCDKVGQNLGSFEQVKSNDPYLFYDFAIAAINCEQYALAQKFTEGAVKNGYSLELLKQDIQFHPIDLFLQQMAKHNNE